MRFGITAKLFLAILATCLVVAVAMGVAMRYTLQTGFRSYVEQREQQRATALALVLSELYSEGNGWDFLREQPRRWWRILRSAPDRVRGGERREGYTPPPPFYLVDEEGQLVAGAPAESGDHNATPRYPVEV